MDLSLPLTVAVLPDVMTISLFAGQSISVTLLERHANNSCLLLESLKKSAQFPGGLFFPDTFLLIPLPRFSLVD